MRDALSSGTMSRLIGEIYDSALDPGRWPDTLTDIRTELGFANAAMTFIEMQSGRVPLNIMVGPEPQWIERSFRYGADVVALWGGPERLRQIPTHEPVLLSHWTDHSAWEGNRFATDWALPQGLSDVLAAVLANNATVFGSIAFGRHRSRGEIGDLEIDAASLLLPHLQRAVAIGRLLDVKSVVVSSFEATIDTLSVGVLLSADIGINQRGGRLSVLPTGVEAGLLAAVRQAEEGDAAIGRRGFGIHTGSHRVSTVIHVLPLRHGLLRPGLAPDAIAAVFVATASEANRVPADALSALYDLTPAEVRVFGEIAAGRTRTEAARTLGVEPATVKAHLSQIFHKTGAKRQADLVALNAAIALPLRN